MSDLILSLSDSLGENYTDTDSREYNIVSGWLTVSGNIIRGLHWNCKLTIKLQALGQGGHKWVSGIEKLLNLHRGLQMGIADIFFTCPWFLAHKLFLKEMHSFWKFKFATKRFNCNKKRQLMWYWTLSAMEMNPHQGGAGYICPTNQRSDHDSGQDD